MPETVTTQTFSPEFQAMLNALLQNAGVIASRPYQPYNGERVAPLNAAFTQALQGATSLAGSAPWTSMFDQAANYAAQGALPLSPATMGPIPRVTAPSVRSQSVGALPQWQPMGYSPDIIGPLDRVIDPDTMGRLKANIDLKGTMIDPVSLLISERFTPEAANYYMNPYTEQVIDRTYQDIDREELRALNQEQLRAAGAGAFGGASMALKESELQRNTDDLRARTGANLRERAYEAGRDQFNKDVTRDVAVGQYNIDKEFERRKHNAATTLTAQIQDRAGAQFLADLVVRARAGDQAAANQARQFLAQMQNQSQAQNIANELTRLTGNADRSLKADTSNQAAGLSASQSNQAAALRQAGANMDAINQFLTGNRSALTSAAGIFGNLGQAGSNLAWNDIRNLAALAGIAQTNEQAQAQAAYEDFITGRDWDRNQLNWLAQTIFGAPRSQTQVKTTPGADTTGQIIGGLTALAPLLRSGAGNWLGNQISSGFDWLFGGDGGLGVDPDWALWDLSPGDVVQSFYGFADGGRVLSPLELVLGDDEYVEIEDDEPPLSRVTEADDIVTVEDGTIYEGGEEDDEGELPSPLVVASRGDVSALDQIARLMQQDGPQETGGFWSDPLLTLGLSIMAAASQPGATTLGAIGKGGIAAQGAMAEAEKNRLAQKKMQQAAALKGIELDQKAREADKGREVTKRGQDMRLKETELSTQAGLQRAMISAQAQLQAANTRAGAALATAKIGALTELDKLIQRRDALKEAGDENWKLYDAKIQQATRSMEPLVEVYDESSPTQTRMVSRSEAEGMPGKPASGMEFEFGPDGKPVRITTGRAGKGNDASGLTPAAKTDIDKTMIDLSGQAQQVQAMMSKFNPKFQQVPTRFKNLFASIKDKAGVDLTDEEKAELMAFTNFRSETAQYFTQMLKDLSGAAVTPQEAERNMQWLPVPGTGLFDGDSPAVMETKLQRLGEFTTNATARLAYVKGRGLKIEDVPLEEMPTIIRRRGRELEAKILKDNPDVPLDDIKKKVRAALASEFGLME